MRPEEFRAQLETMRRDMDAALAHLADRYLSHLAGQVVEAVRYSLAGGGKRLRAILLYAVYRAARGSGEPQCLAASVEVVHAYSLIHDDLPCMDDDDVRRGRPSVHRAYDVDSAVLAGAMMIPLAARAAFDAALELGLPPDGAGGIVAELMKSAGAEGMIGGQLLDLEAETQNLGLADLEQVHAAKTGALMSGAAVMGALAAGAEPVRVEAARSFGRRLGLAFQIADDVLDVTATSGALGKTAGNDARLGKSTYPSLIGVDAASALARSVAGEALALLSDANMATPLLLGLTEYAVDRHS